MKKFLPLILCFLLVGCSGRIVKNRTATGGVGTIYEPRGLEDKEIPTNRFSINIHFEQRPEEGALKSLAQSIQNITGIPQAVVTALTSPERSVERIVGGDRYEIHIPFEIDNPENKNIGIKIDIGEKIQKAIDKTGLDATVVIGSKDGNKISLDGLSVTIIKTDNEISFSEVENN